MHKKNRFLGMLFLGISTCGFAQQQTDSLEVEHLKEVVVTDSKFKLKRENSGKVITKITQKELQHLQGKTVAEIINNTVGIEINGSRSHAGQNLSYFIRGGRNRQVLVLIDGIAVTDASQIANDYDLRLLNVDQVENIEILKGASSTLYGSGAATAVINIKLKDSSKRPIAVSVNTAIGSNQSQTVTDYALEHFMNSVSVNGGTASWNYLASFGHQYTNGLSAVVNGSEADAYNAHNGYLKLGYRFFDNLKFQGYASFDKFKAEFDDGFSLMDADNLSTTEQHRIGISPEFTYDKGSVVLNAAFNETHREISSSFPTEFYAKSYIGDLYNRYNFKDTFYVVLGVNAQQNSMESSSIPFGGTSLSQDISSDQATFKTIDPYANVVFASDFGLNVNAGLRWHHHNIYGNHVVYSVNPSYKKAFEFGYIKGLASYSTAFIAPSLYQLFEPTYGNTDLQPEENRTIEIGAEVKFDKKATLSVVYFNRHEKNFVDFVDLGQFVYQYANTNNDFTASGIEVVADLTMAKRLNLRVNGAYTKVEEDLNLRIPEVKVNATMDYTYKRTYFRLSYQFNDQRNDSFFNNETFMTDFVSLDAYSLFNIYFSQKIINEKVTFFLDMSNILNTDYQELYGYTTKGRNVLLGCQIKL
ncbi:TonB-dependent receptor plug domain-containing protein [Psychroserpens sp. BH13MA-6]